MNILITGCAGFIGFHLSKLLSEKTNNKIIGIDNLNEYYDVSLKIDRLKILKKIKKFNFHKIDICNEDNLKKIFNKYDIEIVIHLAAQAGVRNSIKKPKDYLNNNLVGFFNIINLSNVFKIKHFIYASTSSVYGDTKKFPLLESDETSQPLSFYAATKKSNEVIAYSYSNIFKLPTTGLRFFTVYGPYGRPDMSLFKFVKNIKNNKKIELYNFGDHYRDFTNVDDVALAIKSLLNKAPKKAVPHTLINIGSNKPIKLKYFLSLIEAKLNKKAKVKLLKLQKGDVHKTHANVKKLKNVSKFSPNKSLEKGISEFIDWFNSYYD